MKLNKKKCRKGGGLASGFDSICSYENGVMKELSLKRTEKRWLLMKEHRLLMKEHKRLACSKPERGRERGAHSKKKEVPEAILLQG